MLEALEKAHEDLQKMSLGETVNVQQKKLITFSLMEIERFSKSIRRFELATELARLGNSHNLEDQAKYQELKQKLKKM